jgi:ribonuclease BN (tRNA processing enzyme)
MMRGSVVDCRVFASQATIDAVTTHLFSEPLFPLVPPIKFIPLTDAVELEQSHAKISFRPLVHPGGSLGFKLELQGKSIAYITDTTVDGSYTDFIRSVDVLIHECYFPDDLSEWAAKTGHSYTSSVAMLAKEANVGRLYLTHIDPQRADDDPIGLKVARAIFPETYIAEDCMAIDF